ncbi:MAG: acyl carrier protein [Solobacterium sp.]|nr:acyl carrier protein [Solobacterium sp.]
MEEIIIRLLAETMETDVNSVTWNRDTDIINEIGIDSLQLVRFLMKLEEELNITIDYEALTFDDLATIGSLAKFLSRFAD